MLIVTH
jgi:E3 ubiquitin-protein ligase SHPRH